MNKLTIAAAAALTTMTLNAGNPFFAPYDTPHGTVPFDNIRHEHYEEAIDRAIAEGRAEIDAICSQTEEPSFANTIVALDHAGQALDRVTAVFFNLSSAMTDDEMMAISDRIVPKITDYSTSIMLNEDLWKRVKAVWDNRANETLDPEDEMLLKETYESFTRNGALLEGEDRETYRRLSNEISDLTNKFSQNVLKELNSYEMWLTADDLSGLPESSIEAAAQAAAEKGRKGEYLFTLDLPVYQAFMKYSDRRDLRQKMNELYTRRNTQGEYSNTDIMRRIANDRLEMAKLLGYNTFADYQLVHTMAQTPSSVYNLLDRLAKAYRPAQQKEFKELAEFAGHEIRPWDYSYYSNKLRQQRFDFDEEALRPYFELSNVVEGVFGLAKSLYGVTFKENKDIPVYHPDVKAYDVIDPDGQYMGVIYTDFFPRPSKTPGAWMTEFKGEWQETDGQSSRPHVSIVMNFTKPTAEKPSLLTPYEVETFLHEFGHALHGLMASTKYKTLSGTNVYRDFVELPSQFNENFMTQKQFLEGFARHYQTGEPIPSEYVDKIIASSQFGAAYACLRQLNFGLIDMAWHTITEPLPENYDPQALELEAGQEVAMFAPVEGAVQSTSFGHIFGGAYGYAAGYYSYKWAEVLDADAFSVFLEKGIYDQESARSFRDNILKMGGTVHPAELYRRFRGAEPSIDALLRRDGIIPPKTELKQPQDN